MSEQDAKTEITEITVKVVSPEGHLHVLSAPPDTAIETVKSEALKYFYPAIENLMNRFKLIQINETHTLTDSLTLVQEHIIDQDELLLVERHVPEAGMLWDLGTLRGPSPIAIVAATSTLPISAPTPPQPDLQSLLSTNEITNELRKILISLIEIGARLAAASRNYKEILESLSEQFKSASEDNVAVVDNPPVSTTSTDVHDTVESTNQKNDFTNNRADELRKFLNKFRTWRQNLIPDTATEDLKTLKELGFDDKNATEALKHTGHNTPAAVMWLLGERGPSLMELVNGLPDGTILRALITQPVIQRGLLNTRMLLAFITMVGQSGSANLWLNAPHGGPLLSQILRTYHAEKYCLAVNQFSNNRNVMP